MKCCKTRFERIIEGWANLTFKNKEVEQIAEHRAHVCAVCRQNNNNWCLICKCYIPAKVRSRTEQCPEKLW